MTQEKPEKVDAGLCFAVTTNGVTLPVVDITNPAFVCEYSDQELATIAEKTRRGIERSRRLPKFILRLMARRSVIMREMLQADRVFVSGMTTYLFKVGPKHFPHGFSGGLDRKMLSTIGPVACRLRLRETSRQIADTAAGLLALRDRPLTLISIAGGAAADLFNALILLNKEHPALLAKRVVRIIVLDIDTNGPTFGARALTALTSEQGPLAGFSAAFSHVIYDWNNTSALAALLDDLDADSVTVGSSEGGIFEYCDDHVVESNLTVLRDATPADFAIIGSLIRDDNLLFLSQGAGAPGLRPRGLTVFKSLVENAGWVVQRTASNPLYHIVTLNKARL
jgi:hypothetical protein